MNLRDRNVSRDEQNASSVTLKVHVVQPWAVYLICVSCISCKCRLKWKALAFICHSRNVITTSKNCIPFSNVPYLYKYTLQDGNHFLHSFLSLDRNEACGGNERRITMGIYHVTYEHCNLCHLKQCFKKPELFIKYMTYNNKLNFKEEFLHHANYSKLCEFDKKH